MLVRPRQCKIRVVAALAPGVTISGDSFAITPRGPFSWAQATDFLESWQALKHQQRVAPVVRMAFPLDRTFEPVAVALHDDQGVLRGRVAGTRDVGAAASQVARFFSLDVDGTGYPDVGRRDERIGKLMAALPGLRPVLFTSPYEAAAWGVMSLRISMKQAAAIRGRLIAAHGKELTIEGERIGCFPTPQVLVQVKTLQGLPEVKIERLHGVARAALAGELDPDTLRAAGEAAAMASLQKIPGIGKFWASGIYLRACGIQDVFPDEPLSIAAAAKIAGLSMPITRAQLDELAEAWRPYRMWVCVLLRVAVARGVITGVERPPLRHG